MPEGRLLVAEDGVFVARTIGRELRGIGYSAAAAAFLEREAVRMARDRCPDLVLMEIQLRLDLDGLQAATETSSPRSHAAGKAGS